jgi:hypothetical protein
VRGVWDGFGLKLCAAHAAASTEIDLPAGRYRVSMRAENLGNAAVPATVDLLAGGANLAHASWPTPGVPITLEGVGPHPGGKLRVVLQVASEVFAGTDDGPTLWISAIEVEPDRP